MLGTNVAAVHMFPYALRYTREDRDLTGAASEVSFWNPDENGTIRRNARAPDTMPGLSRFTECVLHQGRMEAFFLDAIASPSHRPTRRCRSTAAPCPRRCTSMSISPKTTWRTRSR